MAARSPPWCRGLWKPGVSTTAMEPMERCWDEKDLGEVTHSTGLYPGARRAVPRGDTASSPAVHIPLLASSHVAVMAPVPISPAHVSSQEHQQPQLLHLLVLFSLNFTLLHLLQLNSFCQPRWRCCSSHATPHPDTVVV